MDITRRTVVGAVWAAPVIALSVGSPQASASGETLSAYAIGYDGQSHPVRVFVTIPSSANPADITLIISQVTPDDEVEFHPDDPPTPGWVDVTTDGVTTVQTTAPAVAGSTNYYAFGYHGSYILVSIIVKYPGYPDVVLRARTTVE